MARPALNEAGHPWDKDRQMMAALAVAGWRYAAAVGVAAAEPSIGVTEAVITADRARFPDYIRRDSDGLPVFDAAEGASFMHALTALPVPLCRAWLAHAWQI